MIIIESVDYSNRAVTITDGKRSKAVPVAGNGSISRMVPGIELDLDYEQFSKMFFSYEPSFYTPTSALACVGYYGEASK